MNLSRSSNRNINLNKNNATPNYSRKNTKGDQNFDEIEFLQKKLGKAMNTQNTPHLRDSGLFPNIGSVPETMQQMKETIEVQK